MSAELKNHLEKLREDFHLLRSEYNVKKIGVFGSFRHGKQTKSSDVDVLVEFSKPISLIVFVDLQNYLTKLLKRKVDLVSKKALKPRLKKNILDETIYV
jgi:predicted nucleotidyltransferase